MTEFKIQVDDKVVKDFGKELLERFFQDFYTKALLKLASKEILKDWDEKEGQNNDWQLARERAWDKHGNYFLNVIANA